MRSAIFSLLLLLLPASAWAICTQHGAVGSASVQVVPQFDIHQRSYFLMLNSGPGPLWVAIGSTSAVVNATTADMFLKPGASWLMTKMDQANVPTGNVAVISSGLGTTYAFCDY